MAGLILDANYSRLKGTDSPYTRNNDDSRILLTSAELERYIQGEPWGEVVRQDPDRTIQNIFNVNLLMEEILRKLMKIGCDMNQLTDVYIAGNGPTNNHPVLAYDKMQAVCAELFAQAKDAMHQLRPYMPPAVLNKVEKLTGANNCRNVNSLFFIESELFNRLFDNQYGLGLVDANKCLENVWKALMSAPN